jgi:DNA-binding NarL/FixJ family response regulator
MRTLIVDDHAAVRRGVRSAIEDCQDVEIVGEASDGEDAVRQTATLAPELIIMDLSMPVLDGLSAAEIIKTYYPETRILMFSMHKLRDLIDIAKNLGLNGYVSKEDDGPSLRKAVDAVQHNQDYFPS